MGLGSKRQPSLPQTEQEGAGALAEAVPDTKVITCGLMPHAACSPPLSGQAWHSHTELLLCATSTCGRMRIMPLSPRMLQRALKSVCVGRT